MHLPLLSRMAGDLARRGTLAPGTVALMYGGYGLHAALTGLALARDTGSLPAPRRSAGLVGVVAASSGAALCVAGMGRFSGPAEVSGVTNQQLTTTGLYGWSRNPQYVGYVLLLAGLAVTRRSASSLGLAAAAAGVFRWWVPVEEAHLTRIHGESYASYRRSSHRWWGRPRGAAAAAGWLHDSPAGR